MQMFLLDNKIVLLYYQIMHYYVVSDLDHYFPTNQPT